MTNDLNEIFENLKKEVIIGQEHTSICEAIKKITTILYNKIEHKEPCERCKISKERPLYVLMEMYKGHGAWSEPIYTQLAKENVKFCYTCGRKLE